MPTITLTLCDTPEGGVAMSSSYTPARGERCSLAQHAALEIVRRTRAEYGLLNSAVRVTDPAPQPTAQPAATPDTRPLPACPACGSNRQVWRNQITGALTCHRLGCHTSLATFATPQATQPATQPHAQP